MVRSPFPPLTARLRLALPFYLGLGAPAVHRSYPDCRVRAIAGRSPDLVRRLLSLYRGEAPPDAGLLSQINFRCATVTVSDTGERFFFKQFPRHHALHDLERLLRCSRVDRAWRAAHLLPGLGVLTPRLIGTAQAPDGRGAVVEYLAAEWLGGALPYPDLLRRADGQPDSRAALLREFAGHLGRWHRLGLYLRDLVKNVLVREEAGVRSYWLTDLDGLHPLRAPNRRRILYHMRQLAHWTGPLAPEEARLVCKAYLGSDQGPLAGALLRALLP
jgi:hypothetical protein